MSTDLRDLKAAAGAALAIATPARAETVDGAKIFVIDGDTVALPCAPPARGCAERLRLFGVDAPELRGARCEGERILALQARERLCDLLRGPIEIIRGEPATGRLRDPFGRTLGTLVRPAGEPGRPAGDVQADLLRRGLAEPWAPGHDAHARRRAAWCGG